MFFEFESDGEAVAMPSYPEGVALYEDGDEPAPCAICQEEAEPGAAEPTKVQLSCGHVFHAHCVCAWFRERPECPLCRDSPVLAPVDARARAQFVRRFARSRAAPPRLRRIAAALKAREEALRERRKQRRLFRAEHAALLRAYRKADGAVYAAARAVRKAQLQLGFFHCEGMPVPPLRGVRY